LSCQGGADDDFRAQPYIFASFVAFCFNKRKKLLAELWTPAEPSPGKLVDAYVTPEGLAALNLDPSPIKSARSLPSVPTFDGSGRELDWSKAHPASL
jgi:hypothetical protein